MKLSFAGLWGSGVLLAGPASRIPDFFRNTADSEMQGAEPPEVGAFGYGAAENPVRTVFNIRWPHENHVLLKAMSATLSDRVAGKSVTYRPGTPLVIDTVGPGLNVVLSVEIFGVDDRGERVLGALPISSFQQQYGWNDALGVITATPCRRTRWITTRSERSLKDKAPVRHVDVELDLRFVNVSAAGNREFEAMARGVRAGKVVLLEHTGRMPSSWLVVVPPGFDDRRRDVNLVLFLRHKVAMGSFRGGAPHSSPYSDYRTVNFRSMQKYLWGPRGFTADRLFDEFGLYADLPQQLADSGANALLLFPIPAVAAHGEMTMLSTTALEVLDGLLKGLWAEGLAGNASDAVGPVRKTLAVAGWSGGMNDAYRWMRNDTLGEAVSAIYMFDGTQSENYDAPGSPLKPERWLDYPATPERKLMLIGTRYTHASDMHNKHPRAIHMIPEDYLPDNAAYRATLGGPLTHATRSEPPLPWPASEKSLKVIDESRRDDFLTTLLTAPLTELTGLWVESHLGKWHLFSRDETGKVIRGEATHIDGKARKHEPPLAELLTAKGLPNNPNRTTLAEYSYAIRVSLRVDPLIVVPIRSQAELDRLARKVTDFGRYREPGARMRHGWSIVGASANPSGEAPNTFQGHFYWCLKNTSFD